MRPRDRQQFRVMLLFIGLPQESVAVEDSPFAGRLPALDVEMQMRPAPARAFLAKQTDLLSHPDLFTRTDRWLDGFEMGVAIIPGVRVENIDVVVIPVRFV